MADNEGHNGKPEKVPWFVREEADNTIRLVGALTIFALGMVGVFLLEMSQQGGENGRKYVTPELLHSLFAFIAGWVGATSLGKKMNAANNPGGRKP